MEGEIRQVIKAAGKDEKAETLPTTGNTSWLIGKTKKVAIVGCSDSAHLAPFGFDPKNPEEAWEIWGVNNGYVKTPRWTRWFEIHPVKFKSGSYFRRKQIRPGIFEYSPDFRGANVEEYLRMLASLNCPVYMQKKWEIIPKSEAYPLEEVLNRFGNYFTNTISYQIALAIKEGFQEIALFGVDMATGSEYGPQRPSCEFFLGVAAGMGIKIIIPPEADLLKARFLYAFQEREQAQWEKKVANMLGSMEQRLKIASKQRDIAEKQINQYLGAIEGVKETERIWSNLMTNKTWRDME